MTGNLWATDLESKIFSIVKYKAEKSLVRKYPNICFTSSQKATTGSTTYPVVYIHPKSMVELGTDLEGVSINSVRIRIQVDVYSTDLEKTAKDVQAVVLDCFKDLSFKISGFPIMENGDTYFHAISVVERQIDANDVL